MTKKGALSEQDFASLEEMESKTPYRADRNGVIPTVLPASWSERSHTVSQRMWLVSRPDGPMSVIAGVEHHGGRDWLHLSVARGARLPSWDDLKLAKRVLAGPDRQAIQVIPRERDYVNHHPHCLHLFVCLGEDPVPAFTYGGLL